MGTDRILQKDYLETKKVRAALAQELVEAWPVASRILHKVRDIATLDSLVPRLVSYSVRKALMPASHHHTSKMMAVASAWLGSKGLSETLLHVAEALDGVPLTVSAQLHSVMQNAIFLARAGRISGSSAGGIRPAEAGGKHQGDRAHCKTP